MIIGTKLFCGSTMLNVTLDSLKVRVAFFKINSYSILSYGMRGIKTLVMLQEINQFQGGNSIYLQYNDLFCRYYLVHEYERLFQPIVSFIRFLFFSFHPRTIVLMDECTKYYNGVYSINGNLQLNVSVGLVFTQPPLSIKAKIKQNKLNSSSCSIIMRVPLHLQH